MGEVEVRQPRLPLCTKEGGGDRVGLAVVFGHDNPGWLSRGASVSRRARTARRMSRRYACAATTAMHPPAAKSATLIRPTSPPRITSHPVTAIHAQESTATENGVVQRADACW